MKRRDVCFVLDRDDGANIRYSLRQRDKIGDMFRRTVGLNVEACDVFLYQVLYKLDTKMLCAFGS
jgi:predicted MarR family transcription regulator